MQPRKFYVNVADRQIGTAPRPGFEQTIAAFAEDVEEVELYFYEPTGGEPRYLDYSAFDVAVGVGVSTAAALTTSLTAISASISATITSLQNGGSGSNEIQRVSFASAPETGNFSLSFPSRSITVSSITASTCLAANHGLLNGQSVTLTGFSGVSGFSNGDSFFVRDRTTGSFRCATTPVGAATAITASSGGTAQLGAIATPLIRAGASPAEVQSAIAAAGLATGGRSAIGVTGDPLALTLTYGGVLSNINFDNVTIANNTLARPPGLTGQLDFNTVEVAAVLAAGQGDQARFEVEVSDGSLRQTYQTAATISADIIASDSPAPLAADNLLLKDGNNDLWMISVDTDGVLTATKQ